MKYSRICHDCGFKSDAELEYCPECGTAKHENFLESTLYSSVVKYFAKKFPKLENAEMLVGFIINLLVLTIGIILINPIIESSELLWIFLLLYSIQGIIKGISSRQLRFNKLHLVSGGIISAYIGSGIGNLISYTGKLHDYHLSSFFYPDILFKELNSGNGMIIVGALSGVISMMLFKYLLNIMK